MEPSIPGRFLKINKKSEKSPRKRGNKKDDFNYEMYIKEKLKTMDTKNMSKS